jgi:hypothetical protein
MTASWKFGEVWGSLGKFGEVWGVLGMPSLLLLNFAYDKRFVIAYFYNTRFCEREISQLLNKRMMKSFMINFLSVIALVAFSFAAPLYSASGGSGGVAGGGTAGGGGSGALNNCMLSYAIPCMYADLGPQKDLCKFVADGSGSNLCSQGGCGASYQNVNC